MNVEPVPVTIDVESTDIAVPTTLEGPDAMVAPEAAVSNGVHFPTPAPRLTATAAATLKALRGH